VIFAIKQNYEALESKLYDVSFPKSNNFRQHLSRQEVNKISIDISRSQKVIDILSSINGIEIISTTIDKEYIVVRGSIELFEMVFQSTFYKYTYKDESALRMRQYSLPKCLSDIVAGVLNLVDLPFDFEKRSRAKTKTPIDEDINRNAATPSTTSTTSTPSIAPTFNGIISYLSPI